MTTGQFIVVQQSRGAIEYPSWWSGYRGNEVPYELWDKPSPFPLNHLPISLVASTDKHGRVVEAWGSALAELSMSTPATHADWLTALWSLFVSTKSPIEMLGLCAVLDNAAGDIANATRVVVSENKIAWDRPYLGPGEWPIVLTLQKPVARFKLDMALEELFESGEWGRIAIECDGHEFHERTKEQAEHDRSRDRALQADGWSVMRFTGRELHRDARKCAAEVSGMMGGLRMKDWRRRSGGSL
jgi:very-short-patch-repair endonuclease